MHSEFAFPRLTRRHLLKGTAVAASSLLASQSISFRALAATRATASTTQPIPTGPMTQIPLSVASSSAGTIPAAFAGLSYPKEKILGTLFTASDSSLIGTFKRLGPSLLRLGGNQTDQSVWTPNGKGGKQGQVAPADVDNLAAFLKATNWKCLYGINLAGPAPWITTPTLAAEEAAYVVQKLGSYLQSFEIGNEPDLYGRVGNPFAGNWTLDKFIARWTDFRDAIVQRTPGAPISGPADGGNALTWTIPFGQAVTSEKIDMLTQHYYVGNALAASSTVDKLLDNSLNRDIVRELAALNAASQELGLPFRMTECGSFYNTAPVNTSGSYAAALWGLEYLFICAQGGACGVNFMGGGNLPGYPPLLNDATSVTAISPLYYGMLFFTLAGAGELLATEISPGALNVTSYAVSPSTGGLNLVILNKEPVNNVQVEVALPQGFTNAALIELTQLSPGASTPDPMATSGVTIQGGSVHTDGEFYPKSPYKLTPNGNQLSCYVPAMSAVLIHLS
jgi:hypothetical protein